VIEPGARSLLHRRNPGQAFAARRQGLERRLQLVLTLTGERPDAVADETLLPPPFEFEREGDRAERVRLDPGLELRVVCLDPLIAMKTGTGRPKDREDLLQLSRIRRLREEPHG